MWAGQKCSWPGSSTATHQHFTDFYMLVVLTCTSKWNRSSTYPNFDFAVSQHSVECIWAGAWSRKQHAAACSCRMLPEKSARPLLVSWRSLLGWFNSQATRWASRVLGYKNIQTATMQNSRTAGASAKSSIVQHQGWYPVRWLMYLPFFFMPDLISFKGSWWNWGLYCSLHSSFSLPVSKVKAH